MSTTRATKSFTLKNRSRELRFFNRRLLTVIAGIILLVLLLLARLIYLQIYEHTIYFTLSKENRLTLIPIEPTRGLVFDRNGVLLAENIPVFSLDIIPGKIKNIQETINALKKIIAISYEDQQAFYKELKQKRHFEHIPLKIRLTPSEVAHFSVNRWNFPGVLIHARLMRHYPLNATTAHVVGFMGRLNAKELSDVDSTNYSATNYIGKIGIEKSFEKRLHGKVGYQQVETDASGRIVRVLKVNPPIAGENITLTIDSRLARAAEKALGSENGAVVAIQPQTGQLLALVSHPSYDPNLFISGTNAKWYHDLQHSPNRPLYNRALRGLYAPGSIIKPFYALEGLVSGTITPRYRMYDPGYFEYAHHTYFNMVRSGYGWVNLEKAIIVSDDTYFYNLAVNLGIKRIDHALSIFGFGELTHIELEEELSGVRPTPEWKRAHFSTSWYTGDTINMGIGQGYLLTTPLQIANATATLATRGKRYQPYILLKTISSNGMETTTSPTLLSTIDVPKKSWDLVIHAMKRVITAVGGTGFRFGRNASYTVAAKTGTAQVYSIHRDKKDPQRPLKIVEKKYRDNSVFIAFAPIKNPQIAIAVISEHNKIAPRVARKVMDAYLLKGMLAQAKAKSKPKIMREKGAN